MCVAFARVTSWSYTQFDYWQGSSLAGCFTGSNFARRLHQFFTSVVNPCKSDHTTHSHTSTPFQIHFELCPFQEILLICFQWKRMECTTLTTLSTFSVCVSLKLLSHLVLHTIFHSTLLLKQIHHRSLGNFSSSTSRISEELDSSLLPVDFSFLTTTAACIAYTAVVRLSSMCLPFPFASLDRRLWAPKQACGHAAHRQRAVSQVPSLVSFAH